MRRPPPEVPPLLSDAEAQEPETITLPEFDLLDEHDGRIHRYLEGLSGGGNGKQVAGEEAAEPFEVVRARTQKRLRAVRATMELAVDQLADNVHKLERRVAVAGREADVVLGLSARRLREREREEKRRAGTGDMPIMEVLRSLGAMLPGEET